jgi:hypothetical protein
VKSLRKEISESYYYAESLAFAAVTSFQKENPELSDYDEFLVCATCCHLVSKGKHD